MARLIASIMRLTDFNALAARITLIAIALALAGGGLKLWLWRHDVRVVEAHEERIAAKIANRTLAAERRADSSDRKIEAGNRARARKIEERMDDAIFEQPEAAAHPVGPAVAAVLDELRRQGAGEDRGAAGGAD
jgi:hypothetical protein